MPLSSCSCIQTIIVNYQNNHQSPPNLSCNSPTISPIQICNFFPNN
jgi:hypothetical protein